MEKPRINVPFDLETYEIIKLIALKEHRSMNDVVRSWVYEGLNAQVGKDNIDLITRIIREELKNILSPSVERLAALSAKTCVQAATSSYLNAEVIANLLPLDQQQEFKEIYERARKKGVYYTKSKDTTEEE